MVDKTKIQDTFFKKVLNPIQKLVASKPKPQKQTEEILFRHESFTNDKVENYVPWNLRLAAAWSWRLILVIFSVIAVLYALMQIKIVIVPLFIGLLLTVMLLPLNNFLKSNLRFPNALACTVSLILGIFIIFSMFYIASSQILYGMGDLVYQANKGLKELVSWITEFFKQYLHFDDTQMQRYINQFYTEMTSYIYSLGSSIYSSALVFTSSIVSFVAGMLVTFFSVFFFLKDGRKIWYWTVRLFPSSARIKVHESAIRGWITLSSYVRAQIIIAAVDAVSIGFFAYLIGVPLAIPLTVLIFLGSFIPIVGALFSGSIAVLVAFVNNGFTNAFVMLIIILIVQQVEGNLLQPLIMSNSVNLHPLAVLVSVTMATYLMGIVGALFVIPVIAFVNTTLLYLHGYDKFPNLQNDENRPGGPPGQIEKMMLVTEPKKINNCKESTISSENNSNIPIKNTESN